MINKTETDFEKKLTDILTTCCSRFFPAITAENTAKIPAHQLEKIQELVQKISLNYIEREFVEAIIFKEQITRQILPLQRAVSAKKRERLHHLLFHKKPQNTAYELTLCSKGLVSRISTLAEGINFIKTISHVTDAYYLASVIDDGILGKETLRKFKMLFTLGTSQSCDDNNGDEDVVCFGPYDIDPSAYRNKKGNAIVIKLRFDHVLATELHNPCVFVKEHDLGWARPARDEYFKEIKVNNFTLKIFMHSCSLCIKTTASASNKWPPFISVQVPVNTFGSDKEGKIFYGIKGIQKFLVMRFFQYLEQGIVSGHGYSQQDLIIIRNELYHELDSLSDADLEAVLIKIGEAVSQGAEFNFYHGHTITLDNIHSILIDPNPPVIFFDIFSNQTVPKEKVSYENIEFDMVALKKQIAADDNQLLIKLHNKVPTLFSSYRFLVYLLQYAKPKGTVEAFLRQCFAQFPKEKKQELLQMYREKKQAWKAILDANKRSETLMVDSDQCGLRAALGSGQ